MILDDEELASSLAVHTARGVAQLLGLATNYAAAAAYPTDSLRSAAFTRENGLCSSITALKRLQLPGTARGQGRAAGERLSGQVRLFRRPLALRRHRRSQDPRRGAESAFGNAPRESRRSGLLLRQLLVRLLFRRRTSGLLQSGRRSREAHPLPFRESAHRRTTCSGVARRARCGRQLPRRSHCSALAGCPGGDFLHGGLHRRRLLHRGHGGRRADDASRRAQGGAAALCEGDAESHRGPLVARHGAHRRPAGQPPGSRCRRIAWER